MEQLIVDYNIYADISESAKPWKRPSADVTYFFNYGFNETRGDFVVSSSAICVTSWHLKGVACLTAPCSKLTIGNSFQ
jgi:hypothetical protein